MAGLSYVRLYWDIGSSGVTHTIVSAQTSDDTLRIAGDYRRRFLEGTTISISGSTAAGNDGTKIVSADATYDIATNRTVIPISTNLVDDNTGTITEPHKFLEFEFARVQVKPSEPARKTITRLGLVRRIIPVNTASKKRYAIGVTVVPHGTELLQVSNSNVPLAKVIYDECYDDDTEFLIYHYESHLDTAGSEYLIKRFYKGYLDMEGGQDMLGSLIAIDGDGAVPNLPFTCHADGTYTYLGNSSTMSTRTRPNQ